MNIYKVYYYESPMEGYGEGSTVAFVKAESVLEAKNLGVEIHKTMYPISNLEARDLGAIILGEIGIEVILRDLKYVVKKSEKLIEQLEGLDIK